MNTAQALARLKQLGTAQNRKVYARHGVGSDQFGVSYANLGKLQKELGKDQSLAEGLWKSGNHDARVLATMIAEPSDCTARLLEAWAKDLDNYVVSDAFSKLVARTSGAESMLKKWTASKQEWIGRAGWLLVALLTSEGQLSDDRLGDLLATVEREIHTRKNRVRDAMVMALINIGLRSAWEAQAIAVARKIGKVEVDHGETGCKTPDAIEYIARTKSYRKKKK